MKAQVNANDKVRNKYIVSEVVGWDAQTRLNHKGRLMAGWDVRLPAAGHAIVE